MANKKGTVTISVEDYDNLCNGFDASKSKQILDKKIEYLQGIIEANRLEMNGILNSDFLKVEKTYSFITISKEENYYFKKDKTPLWIRKMFNKF